MEDLQEQAYADLVRPESSHDAEPYKSPPAISRQPAVPVRQYRLSLSPLDSLQAEFQKYNDMEKSGNLRLSQSASERNTVSMLMTIGHLKQNIR